MMYDLPTSLEVCGTEYPIETDFRVILDIFSVLSAVELTSEEKCIGVLGMFYPGFFTMPWEHMEEAIKQCFWFINGGNEEAQKKSTKLMDWEQDFRLLVAPINRIAGQRGSGAAVSTLVDVSFVLRGNRGLLLRADRAYTRSESKRQAKRQNRQGVLPQKPRRYRHQAAVLGN